jgi:hypothetical protein
MTTNLTWSSTDRVNEFNLPLSGFLCGNGMIVVRVEVVEPRGFEPLTS